MRVIIKIASNTNLQTPDTTCVTSTTEQVRHTTGSMDKILVTKWLKYLTRPTGVKVGMANIMDSKRVIFFYKEQ